MALAIYQTGRLWTVNITNRSFFTFLAFANPVSAEQFSIFAKPFRLISGSGDGAFAVRYNAIPNSDLYAYGCSAAQAAIGSGEYAGTAIADYGVLYSGPVCVFEYAFEMPSEHFAAAQGLKAGRLTSRGVDSFAAIIIKPPGADHEAGLSVYLISGDTAHHFYLADTNKKEPASKYSYEIAAANGVLRYFSDGFGNFAADIPEGGFAFPKIQLINEYLDFNGSRSISHIQSRVEPLFANPATITSAPGGDGVFTFAGHDTVVRFTDRDILEYTGYFVIDRNASPSFAADYLAAVSFINSDPYVLNEFYLSGYESSAGRNVFYFDFTIRDLPLYIPGGGSAVEVTAERGSVVRYKKLVYGYRVYDEGPETYGAYGAGKVVFNETPTLALKIEDGPFVAPHWFGDNYIAALPSLSGGGD